MPVTPTVKQDATMRFVQATIDRTGTAPTVLEICNHLGLRSKSGAVRLLRGLEDRGYIRRRRSAARAIEVLHRVADCVPTCPHCHRPLIDG